MRGGRPGVLGPRDEARGRPLRVGPVGVRHVVGLGRHLPSPASRRCDATRRPLRKTSTVVAVSRASTTSWTSAIGDGVVVAVELDVVVDVDARSGPLAVDEGLGRQRPQRGLIEPLEQLPPAGAVQAHGRPVEVGRATPRSRAFRAAREKKRLGVGAARGSTARRPDTPASTLALSRGFAGRAGQDRGAVVRGEILEMFCRTFRGICAG